MASLTAVSQAPATHHNIPQVISSTGNGSASTPRSSSQYNTSSNSTAMPPSSVKRIHREVRFGAYILGSTLGEGEFGKVKLGWRKDGKHPSQVAIKLIKRASILKDSDSEVKIHREINSLKLLSHPNIVSLVEVMKSGKYIGIVLEYASGGELFDYILTHKYLKENVAKKLFAQLVSGVDYMHSKGLIHRDLKLENLLLDKHKNVIISDFGFVNSYNRDKNDLMKTSCGSPCYAAPELVLTQSPYEGRKVDIWSLGVILYAMLSGYLPFDDDPENEDGSDIVKLYHYICKSPLTFPEYVSPLARDLLRKIIVPDPRKRININDIRNHPWLSPYANLLSIRQPEWDRIHKENLPSSGSSSASASANGTSASMKRFSMINERTNSSSLMGGTMGLSSSGSSIAVSAYTPVQNHANTANTVNGNTGHSRSYSSTSISSQLYSSPSISSSLANAVALPKLNTDSSNYTTANNTNPNSSYVNVSDINASARSSPSPTKSRHVKSASISNPYPSASIALKAVVNENNGTNRNSISGDSLSQPLFASPPPPTTSSNNKNYHYSTPSQRATTTYTGSVISTIVESPTKPQQNESIIAHISGNGTTPSPSQNNNFCGLLPPSSQSPGIHSGTSSPSRLPHSHKKPRPTSYHPSSMTSSLMSNSGFNGAGSGSSVLLDYIKMPSPITNLPMPQFLSTSPTKASPVSETSSEMASSCGSPVGRSPRTANNSRRNSVVTHVHVNGVLSNDTVVPSSNSPDPTNKRNSVLSYLEDKIDTLELKSFQQSQQLQSDGTPQINQSPIFDTQTSPSSKGEEKEDEKENKDVEMQDAEGQNTSDTTVAGADSDSIEKFCPLENVIQEKYPESVKPIDVAVSAPLRGSRGPERTGSTHSRKESSLSAARDKEYYKENKESKKRNRFSLLSFYSTYNSSTSNVSSLSNSTAVNTITNTSHDSNPVPVKKILEPSSEANVAKSSKDQKRINSSSSSHSKRSSISISTSSTANGKEASAARKVMDFFKRRSVRIS
ncbi:uncharacterized protein RJT20DRAFT_134159 [Scheffersomyces xylosifermentans]|uniref:uncharacterized protein n=1 Tax=Scheffersomyces xylosifermentans TaxID=1304137 RepID=UPI00315C5F1A